MLARNTGVNIKVNNVDATKIIAPFVKSFSFSDGIESEADTCEMELADADKLLLNGLPERGSSIDIAINKIDNGAVESLRLGSFELDEIEYGINGNGSSVKLKLNSIPNSAKIRHIQKSRSWEQVSFRKIAQDIANAAGLTLYYDTDNPTISRAEQSVESDLGFLKRLCTDNGFLLKVSDGRLIICDAYTYESKAAIMTLDRADKRILSFSGRATLLNIYADANVSFLQNKINNSWLAILTNYLSGKSGLNLTRKLANNAGNNILEINRAVSDGAQAQRLAKKLLRDKNKNEMECTLKTTGDFNFLSGNNINLSGFGLFDGKYIITKASHTINSGYTDNLNIRKCLTY